MVTDCDTKRNVQRIEAYFLKNYSEMAIKVAFENKQENTDFKQTTKIKVFALPTDVQENCFQRGIKIYIKIKKLQHVSLLSPSSSGRVLCELAKVSVLKQLVKIHRCG